MGNCLASFGWLFGWLLLGTSSSGGDEARIGELMMDGWLGLLVGSKRMLAEGMLLLREGCFDSYWNVEV